MGDSDLARTTVNPVNWDLNLLTGIVADRLKELNNSQCELSVILIKCKWHEICVEMFLILKKKILPCFISTKDSLRLERTAEHFSRAQNIVT
jgi:hypothetical protein